jgi:Spy/CpxP family protein refolding chaperone
MPLESGSGVKAITVRSSTWPLITFLTGENTMKTSLSFMAILALTGAAIASAQPHEMSPHAGKQTRQIASLSDMDIAAIRKGNGWGLALPAEVNGAPGPRHVLDLAEPLELSDEQIAQITTIYEEMKRSAISTGAEFIAAEQALNDVFERGGLDQTELAGLVEQAGDARARLRLVHLSAHLKTLPLLTEKQVELYAQLRGYAEAGGDPCAAVPEGHDPVMWKLHNGCE